MIGKNCGVNVSVLLKTIIHQNKVAIACLYSVNKALIRKVWNQLLPKLQHVGDVDLQPYGLCLYKILFKSMVERASEIYKLANRLPCLNGHLQAKPLL